jgi:hypothetical protein
VKPFASEMTPDDRGYSKFNRFRGSFSQKFGMTHVSVVLRRAFGAAK